MSALRDEIRTAFSGAGLDGLSQDMLGKCMALASTLHVSPSQMAESWEAYSLNKNVMELTDTTFQPFRNALFKDTEGATGATAAATITGVVVARAGLGKRNNAPMVTPTPNKQRRVTKGELGNKNNSSAVDSIATASSISISPEKQPPVVLPKYNERTNVGKVVLTYNPHQLPLATSTSQSQQNCVVDLSSYSTNTQEAHRHMFTPLDERSKALDQHLVHMGQEIANAYGIPQRNDHEDGDHDDDDASPIDNEKKKNVGNDDIAPLEAVGVPRQDTVCCVGRICNEAHEGRINTTSVLIEGSRHLAGGARISLDVSELKKSKKSFSLFPGQIVAVEGLNTSGRKMVAHRICEGAPLPPPTTPSSHLYKYQYSEEYLNGQPLSIQTMCGPYTTSDNLDYEPLVDALALVRVQKPNVVVLCGPFVDMRQPLVASGNTTVEVDEEGNEKLTLSYEMLFAHKIAALIEDLFENEPDLKTQFVLVPSLDDANAEWVYPQAPLTDRLSNGGKTINLPGADGIEAGTLGLQHIETAGGESKNRRRVHYCSNPCTLVINEVVVGVTSTDTLMHINTDETSANLEPGSRLGRIAQHLLQQRSYYPLFPPPASSAGCVNLDLGQMQQWNMPCQPDILIVPSKLTCFARSVLENTVVVNPGQLSRGTTGGTYAVMDIHPMPRETLEVQMAGGADVEVTHNVQDRIRVEVKRI